MKFKVGDKVRVRKDLKVNEFYGGIGFVRPMEEFKGKIVTIKKAYISKYSKVEIYHIKEDSFNWNFTEKMLELVEEITLKDLKLGDILTVRDGRKYIKINMKRAVDILDGCSWINLNFYKNDLIEKCNNEELDIMKVERAGVVIFERKKEILDKQEKEYLRNLIRPFRDRVINIIKENDNNGEAFITITVKRFNDKDRKEAIMLPYFKKHTMYKGMELDKSYTLEELGL